MPTGIKPMLCTLLKEPFSDPDYLYEVKWDGYRLLTYKDGASVKLSSRGGLDYTRKYPPIARALGALPQDVVIDGEAIVLNKEGKPDFDALQKFNGQQSGVFFYAFDILWADGNDLMRLPLVERKQILKSIVQDNSVIRYSEDFDDGIALFRHAEAMKLEGIIAKQRSSPYMPDRRGREWYKIPTAVRQEFVVGGWVESETRLFRTLLFGAYRGEDLYWIGHAGGGFKEREMKDILARLKSLEVKRSPFANEVEYDGVAHWVRPELVANIRYATVTRSGKIRKPAIFLGFRDDKNPGDVVPETAGSHLGRERQLPAPSEDSNWPMVEEEKKTTREVLELEDCKLEVYNVNRVLWKGVTKGHLLQYYLAIAPWILPHIKDRPLSLHLKLKGPRAPGAYIKDMEGRQPDCAEVFTTPRKHHKSGKRDVIDYLVCNNTPTLLYTINLGCIDVNPWTSSTASPLTPDYIVIDLDPSDKDFSKAIDAALAAKEIFDQYRLKSFPKTSGKTGIHLYIPCSGFNFTEARRIAENICQQVHGLVPDSTTTEVSVDARRDKLYLDPNQNDYADTVAAPYCVRPAGRPTVSAPLEWREVKRSLEPTDFTLQTMQKRVEKKGDLFAGVLDRRLAKANEKGLKRLLSEG